MAAGWPTVARVLERAAAAADVMRQTQSGWPLWVGSTGRCLAFRTAFARLPSGLQIQRACSCEAIP